MKLNSFETGARHKLTLLHPGHSYYSLILELLGPVSALLTLRRDIGGCWRVRPWPTLCTPLPCSLVFHIIHSTYRRADIYGLLRFGRFRPWNDWNHFNSYVVSRWFFDLLLIMPQWLPGNGPVWRRPSSRYALFLLFCFTLTTLWSGSRAQAILKPILLRRTKNSRLEGKPLLELPPKQIEIVKLQFSHDEREVCITSNFQCCLFNLLTLLYRSMTALNVVPSFNWTSSSKRGRFSNSEHIHEVIKLSEIEHFHN